MRSFLKTATTFSLAVQILVCGRGIAHAGSASSSVDGMPVSLKGTNTPVKAALGELFHKAHVQYVLDLPVTGAVNFEVDRVPFQVALDALLAGNNPQLDFYIKAGIYHIKLWKPELSHLRDVFSANPDFQVQSTVDTQVNIPPGTPLGISNFPFPMHLEGQVVIRPRVMHKAVCVAPAGDRLLLQYQPPGDAAPETFDVMKFDTASMTVEVTADSTVFRDQAGHALTVYTAPQTVTPAAEPTSRL